MERELVLSSYDVKNTGNNRPENFVIKYDNAIINTCFTWYNVGSNLNNQLIRFSSDGGKTFTNITFLEGTWGYEDFNKYIHKKLTSYKDKFGKEKYPINLIFNETNFRVTITLDNNYQFDLTKRNFNDSIGYDKK